MKAAPDQLGLRMRPDRLIAGVDEAGRGPLAGPVVTAAVILAPGCVLEGVADSKTLDEARRLALAETVRREAVAWAVAWSDPAEIDAINILAATMLAMRRAVRRLAVRPRYILVDGDRLPELDRPAEALVRGDASELCISAASILAKVHRDALMCRAAERYPVYGFEGHKGYGTPRHIEALAEHGPCPLHRRSFRPVHESML